jgi:hypothetical protein
MRWENSKKQMDMIDEPELFDVLCGRGKPIQKHPGNMLLHRLIDKNCHIYHTAPRLKRRAIANEIVQGLKSKIGKLPGRFLLREIAEEGWKEVSDNDAIDKVSHCFRARRKSTQEMSSTRRVESGASRANQLAGTAADGDCIQDQPHVFAPSTGFHVAGSSQHLIQGQQLQLSDRAGYHVKASGAIQLSMIEQQLLSERQLAAGLRAYYTNPSGNTDAAALLNGLPAAGWASRPTNHQQQDTGDGPDINDPSLQHTGVRLLPHFPDLPNNPPR